MRAVPGQLTLAQLHAFYLRRREVELDRACRARVDQAAETVRAVASGDEAVYGVNTGFGKLANTRIPSDRASVLQRNLLHSHCCGIGPDLPPPVVRLIMLLKLCSLGRGHRACGGGFWSCSRPC